MTTASGSSPNKAFLSTPYKVRNPEEGEAEKFDVTPTESFEFYSPGIYIEIDQFEFAPGTPAVPDNFPVSRGKAAGLAYTSQTEIWAPFTEFYDEGINDYMLLRFINNPALFNAIFSRWPVTAVTFDPLVSSLPLGYLDTSGGAFIGTRADIDDPNGQYLARNPGLLPSEPSGDVLTQGYIGNRVVSLAFLQATETKTLQAAYLGYLTSYTSPARYIPLAGGSINISRTDDAGTGVYGQAPRVLKSL